MEKQLMIGGQALVQMGSSRSTNDTNYLINDESSKLAFIHDTAANVDYCNASGNKFFAEVWEMEKNNIGPLASPQALLELKAYSFVQHALNYQWNKLNDAEYDIKFLVLTQGVSQLKIVGKHITKGQMEEVKKVIASAKRN